MLAQVLASWQVWVATVFLVAYMFLVGYVARIRQQPGKPSSAAKRKKKKKEPQGDPPEDGEYDDDLGLEDTKKR